MSEIKLDDSGAVSGVLLADQQFIRSPVVLSNATPKVTFIDLLPDGALPTSFKSMIKNINYESPVVKINGNCRYLNIIYNYTYHKNYICEVQQNIQALRKIFK